MKGDFRQYLLAEIGRTDCANRANVLLSLISQDDTHSFTPIENSALFFNYTHPQIKMQETYVIIQYWNVHSELSNDDIVFGFDVANLESSQDISLL